MKYKNVLVLWTEKFNGVWSNKKDIWIIQNRSVLEPCELKSRTIVVVKVYHCLPVIE